MSKDASTIQRELAQPFAPEDLEWRLQRTVESQGRGLAVPYVTNRAIQDRLDDVVGPQNWYNDFKPWHTNGKKESQICGIAIFFEEHGGFITKWDGAEDTDIEAIKGGLSDSMKRAAVQWGIGRVLYKMDVAWVDVEKSGKSWIIKSSERAKLDAAYLNLLKRLKLTPAKPGGLQSELTAANTPETLPENEKPSNADAKPPTRKQQDAKATESPTQGRPSSGNITELPSAKQPEPEYKVKSAKVQSGMNRNPTTSLTLIGRDGKAIQAFLRGTDPALVPDALLTNVDLTLRQQDTVVFFVLNTYEVIRNTPQAA